jgi:hypothetical protein
MEKRIISVVLSGDLHKKLRALQGKMIKDSKENISFSQVINDVLMRGLVNSPK